jgi:tetratricopeptide (TPR) repeat protein
MAMAKNHIFAINFPLSTTQLLALNLGLVTLAPIIPAEAQERKAPVYKRQTKDFKHPKRFIVPASEIQRRIDYQAFGTRDSLMLPTYIPKYPPAVNGSTSPFAQLNSGYQGNIPDQNLQTGTQSTPPGSLTSHSKFNDRQGLTPPPPPAKTSLLPQSLTHNQATINKHTTPQHSPGTHLANLSTEQSNKIKAESQRLVQRSRLQEAQALLLHYCQEDPTNNVLGAELAKVSLGRAKFHQSKKEYETAASQARIAIAYGGTSDTASQAQHYLQESLTKLGVSGKDSAQRTKLATQQAQKGNYLQAEVEFIEAAKLSPSFSPYLEAGDQAMKAHRLPQAKEHYLKSLELNPDSQITLRQLGIARYYLNDHVGANADLTRALVLNTQDSPAAQTLFQLWQQQVQARPNDPNSHLGLARAYQIAGNLPAAQSEYLKVVALNPQHPNLPAARQSFKLAYARQEAHRAFQESQTLANQGALHAAYQKAHEAVEYCPSDNRYLNQKASLGEKLGPVALPQRIASGQSTILDTNSGNPQTIPGEATPMASIPTAANLGLTARSLPPTNNPGAPTALFAAENMYRPQGSDQHVATIAGFLKDIRNTAVVQRNQIKATEKTTQSILGALGAPSKENTPPIAGTLANLDRLNTGALNFGNTNLELGAINLDNPNKELAAPLALALPQEQSSDLATQPLATQAQSLAESVTLPGQASKAQAMALPAPNTNLRVDSPATQPLNPQALPPAQENAPMRLLLTGVRASKNEVLLKVVLSNPGSKTITLPAKLKAIVKDKNLTEKLAKTNLSNRKLAAGDSITGTIQVPGKALDPRADIFLDLQADSNHGILNPTAVHLSLPTEQKP